MGREGGGGGVGVARARPRGRRSGQPPAPGGPRPPPPAAPSPPPPSAAPHPAAPPAGPGPRTASFACLVGPSLCFGEGVLPPPHPPCDHGPGPEGEGSSRGGLGGLGGKVLARPPQLRRCRRCRRLGPRAHRPIGHPPPPDTSAGMLQECSCVRPGSRGQPNSQFRTPGSQLMSPTPPPTPLPRFAGVRPGANANASTRGPKAGHLLLVSHA